MLRLISFFSLIFFLIYSFMWISYYPGDVSLHWRSQIYKTSPFIALSLFYLLLLIFVLLLKISQSFLSWISFLTNIFQKHNRRNGYSALSTGLIAIAASNKILARKMFYHASRYLNSHNEPLLHLLETQIALADKQNHVAHKKFETMLNIPATQELALHGLYLESCRTNDLKSARRHAEKAMQISPHSYWSIDAVLQDYANNRKWSEAIDFLKRQKKINTIDIDPDHRKEVILLQARSLDNLTANDIVSAYQDASAALNICSNSIIASISAARSLIAQKKTNKAEVILEKIWKTDPHPEIAHIYTTLLSKNKMENFKRSEKLESINKDNVESLLAVAKAALEIGDIDTARTKAMLAVQKHPRKGIYLLLSEIERANSQQILYWTQKALYAIPDPLWMAEDGFLSEKWLPISPISKTLCHFEWKVPIKITESIASIYPQSPVESENSEKIILSQKQNNTEKSIPINLDYRMLDIMPLNMPLRQPDDPGVEEIPQKIRISY
ncbi:heme biosynthesis protein HemY [Candidatus Liberibacter sp.]|uniref:heme biosynthesis protein HemY n=1 Tax=Candidatus Liberibacter sp. TaxID=34022 RepID=UPI0015F4CEC4|nr:heme biosynthesis HemY N-terminal domain-containing protein [Candidatus Liberibacter sp.]MBA5724156.1 heme biosynthesis protein HemY [Candidatus Liberibacter sp.]